MTTYPTKRWFRRFTRVFVAIALGGGILMLAGAAAAHDSTSIPLLVIGGFWFIAGTGAVHAQRTVAREIQLHDGQVTFVFSSRQLTVPATEITEVGRPRYDLNRMQWVNFQSVSKGRIRVTPRLRGMVELLVALRAANPNIKFGDTL